MESPRGKVVALALPEKLERQDESEIAIDGVRVDLAELVEDRFRVDPSYANCSAALSFPTSETASWSKRRGKALKAEDTEDALSGRQSSERRRAIHA